MLAIVVFILVLGTLVLVHEAGHFVVARRNGLTCEEFGIGFPPRLAGFYVDAEGKRRWVFGTREIKKTEADLKKTVYSLNLIPIGGFVKIKGEDGEDKNAKDSFASQSIFVRFKILVAGVVMNAIVAVLFFGFAFWIGLPEAIGDEEVVSAPRVQVSAVAPKSPAQKAKLEMGDTILAIMVNGESKEITTITEFQELTSAKKGSEVEVEILPSGEEQSKMISLLVRDEIPEGEGAIGVQLVRTSFVSYGFFQSMWMGLETTWRMTGAILAFLGDLIMRLVTPKPVATDVAGPVGIAILTGQVAKLGLAYVLQFAGMLSVNLAVINLLPFPALDGGRIFFLIIEKIKGSPVSEKTEGLVHTAGFIFLMSLMVLVTVKDFKTFQIIDKVKDLF